MGMEELRFIWHAKKGRANQTKHGVSFEEAKTAFFDHYARLIEDAGYGEERIVLLGVSVQLRVLVVCHCYGEKVSFAYFQLERLIRQKGLNTPVIYDEKALRFFEVQSEPLHAGRKTPSNHQAGCVDY